MLRLLSYNFLYHVTEASVFAFAGQTALFLFGFFVAHFINDQINDKHGEYNGGGYYHSFYPVIGSDQFNAFSDEFFIGRHSWFLLALLRRRTFFLESHRKMSCCFAIQM